MGRYNRAWPPLDLLNCAAVVERAGHRVSLWDGRTLSQAASPLAGEAADLIFVTSSPLDRWQCPNLELDPVLNITGQLPKDRLFLLGVHGTLFPAELLRLTGARGVVRGEPESAVGQISEIWANNQKRDLSQVDGLSHRRGEDLVHNPDRRPLALAALPRPAYHLIDLSAYTYDLLGPRLALVEASRGCPWSCAFCLKALYPPGLRAKPPDQVVEEVEVLVRDHRAESIYFIDLEFTVRRAAVEELCRGLMRRRLKLRWCCQARVDTVDEDLLRLMRLSGLELIHFGVETASPQTLRRSGKNITPSQIAAAFSAARKAGLKTAGFFMVGLPGEGLKEARATIDLACGLKPTFASFHAWTPYPGTPWGGEAESWEAWSPRARERLSLWAPFLRRAYARYYLRPAYLPLGLSGLRRTPWGGALRLWWGFVK